jgi:hypothetical protein
MAAELFVVVAVGGRLRGILMPFVAVPMRVLGTIVVVRVGVVYMVVAQVRAPTCNLAANSIREADANDRAYYKRQPAHITQYIGGRP